MVSHSVSDTPTIAIVGIMGVPARYGGFETSAEQIARHVSPITAKFVIYGQKSAYQPSERVENFFGHERKFIPLKSNNWQSVIHDAIAIIDVSIRLRPDAMLVLGTSGAWILPLARLIHPNMRIVTNIGGREWKRDKWGPLARAILKLFEHLAVRFSHSIIVDNEALLPVFLEMYRKKPDVIAYGGDHIQVPPVSWWGNGLAPSGHWLSIARIQPDNNCTMILEAALLSRVSLVYVGNWEASAYGRSLRARFGGEPNLMLMDPVYDLAQLRRLRTDAQGYVHGHSMGGTNPSLVEALFVHDRFLVFDCSYNRSTLDDAGSWFKTAEDLASLMTSRESGKIDLDTLQRLRARYHWESVSRQYLDVLVGSN